MIEVKLRWLSNFAKIICENFQNTVLPDYIMEWRKLILLDIQ
jgi:hypothetical protein